MVRSCARRSLAAETIFMALVICCVFLTERMRRRISIKLGMCLGQPLPNPAKPEPNRNAYSTQRRRERRDKRREHKNGHGEGLTASLGTWWKQRAPRKYSANSGENSTREVLRAPARSRQSFRPER